MQNLRYTEFHLTNPLPDQDQISNIFTTLINEYKDFRKNVPIGCITDRCSAQKKEQQDCSIFSGAGGYLYLYLRLYEFITTLPNDIQAQCNGGLSDAELPQFFNPETYLELAQKQFNALNQSFQQDKDISFLISSSGFQLLGAKLFYILKDKHKYDQCIQKVFTNFAIIVAQPNSFDQELLYGIPGYLYQMLYVHKNFAKVEPEYQLDMSSHIHNLVKIILEQGKGNLEYKFHNRTYFGGAHGVLGVIQMILLSYLECKEYFHLKDEQGTLNMLQLIKKKIDEIIQLYYQKGNIPSSAENLNNTQLYQFCHGITGAVAPILLAYKVYNHQDYINAVIHMCENLYKFGMLKKGYGICHGIPGNSYCFLQLYNITKNEKLRGYAYQFLQYKSNPHVYNDIKHFAFKDRYNIGQSDNPYSLMLGSVGDMCALMDFIQYKGMPSYEI